MYDNENTEIDQSTVAVFGSGQVEYSLREAVVEIDELINLLQSAKSEGAQYVVASSGNYRGAQWARISSGHYGWADED